MRSVPPDGGETQPIIRIVDVLPAPFGPRKPKASPRPDVEVDRRRRQRAPRSCLTSPRACTSGSCAAASTIPFKLTGPNASARYFLPAMQAAWRRPSGDDSGGLDGARGRWQRGGCRGRRVARFMRRRDGDDRAARRRPRDLLRRRDGRARNLDCFVAVPGLGAEGRAKRSCCTSRFPFGEELVHYAVGPGLLRRPGAAGRARRPSGASTACCRGRSSSSLPSGLLASGVDFPPAHAACLAMLAPVMTMNEGGRASTRPADSCCRQATASSSPGSSRRWRRLPTRAPRLSTADRSASRCSRSVRGAGRSLTHVDFDVYEAALERAASSSAYFERHALHARRPVGDPRDGPAAAAIYMGSTRRRGFSRSSKRSSAPIGWHGDTTNVTSSTARRQRVRLHVEPRARLRGLPPGSRPSPQQHARRGGSACAARSSRATRMDSMMAPTLAFDRRRVCHWRPAPPEEHVLRTALLGVVCGDPRRRPRCGRCRRTRTLPPRSARSSTQSPASTKLRSLNSRGAGSSRPAVACRHHYFGGVSVVSRMGAAGDPRRSGAASTPP